MSAFDPFRVPVVVAGFILEWFVTRRWKKILVGAIPFLFLGGLAVAVWLGGQMNRNALADKYMSLGAPIVEQWEQKLFNSTESNDSATGSPDAPTGGVNNSGGLPSDTPPNSEVAAATEGTDPQTDAAQEALEAIKRRLIEPYGEMLCKRAELLRESPQTKFVLGTNMLLRGQVQHGVNMLKKISPEDSKGEPKGHAMMAYTYMTQYAAKKDPQLLAPFLHHADAAVEWANTPKDLLLQAAELHSRQRNPDRALEILGVAADRYPELLPMLYDRSKRLGKEDVAETARQKAISNLQGKLDVDPKDDLTRVQMVQLILGQGDGALDQGEKLLKEGLGLGESEQIKRALSEIYRRKFIGHAIEKNGKVDDFTWLEKAFATDATNPLIVETVAHLIRDGIRPNRDLQKALDTALKTDTATAETFATMADFYLASNRREPAITYLEKVFQRAPYHVKYANNLAYLYAEQGKIKEAQDTATQCLTILQQNGLQNAKFVDELLDTLGSIYQKQDKTTDAISAFELSLRLNPDRLDTRTRLADLYEKMGNTDIAAAQREFIEKKKKEQLEKPQGGQSKESSNSPVKQSTTEPPKAEQPSTATAESPEDSSGDESTDDELFGDR